MTGERGAVLVSVLVGSLFFVRHFKKKRDAHRDAQKGSGPSIGGSGGNFVLRAARVVGQPGDGAMILTPPCTPPSIAPWCRPVATGRGWGKGRNTPRLDSSSRFLARVARASRFYFLSCTTLAAPSPAPFLHFAFSRKLPFSLDGVRPWRYVGVLVAARHWGLHCQESGPGDRRDPTQGLGKKLC